MVHLSDGRHLDLRELNKQKGGSGKNGFKHERTFVPGVDNGRPGAVPDHLRAAESAMKSLHTSNLDEFIKRLGLNLATAEYATMVRSGRSYSASKFNAAQKVSSALQRSANEIFRKPINRKLLAHVFCIVIAFHELKSILPLCAQARNQTLWKSTPVYCWGIVINQRLLSAATHPAMCSY